jgi:hypothetical protein
MSSLPERVDAPFADSFTLPDAIMTMGCDGEGRVAGLAVDTGRVRDIRFARRGDSA